MNPPATKPANPSQAKRWRILRRCLVGLGVCLTLVCLFYTEELWRGKRAWENCKRAEEAKGVDFNWAHFAPAPVPENENFFGVPEMQRWFTGMGSTELSKDLLDAGVNINSGGKRMVVAELTMGLPGTPAPRDSAVLRWDDPASRAEAARLLTNALGPSANAPQSPYGLGLMLRRPEEIQPARIFLQCQTAPTEKDLQQFLPDDILHSNADPPLPLLKFEPDGGGSYRVTLPVLAVVADYLESTGRLEPQYALIREALQRPYARMQAKYGKPEETPIPNFVTVRMLMQALGARAQCHFLLDQPGEALRDLTLMHELCRPVMEENQPMTLVAALINAAVRGLYATTIAEGLRLRAGREPQLAALEEQLKQINVLPPLKESMEFEAKVVAYDLEFVLDQPDRKFTPGEVRRNSILGDLLPRGWIYQNLVNYINLSAGVLPAVDPGGGLVIPGKIDAWMKQTNALWAHWSPYTFIDKTIVPNWSRACQSTAHHQTKINQALIACALERYRLARGQYPENLDALIPQFIDKIPHDVIGGRAPHYHRAADGTFILYSIGWNRRDLGGVRGKFFQSTDCDWVWPD